MATPSNFFEPLSRQKSLSNSEKYISWRQISRTTSNIPSFFRSYDRIFLEIEYLKDKHLMSILEQEKKVEEVNLINRVYDKTLALINNSDNKIERFMFLDVCFQYINHSIELFEPQNIKYIKKQHDFIEKQIERET